MLEQCLGWVFVYFGIHAMVHGCVPASACRAGEARGAKVG